MLQNLPDDVLLRIFAHLKGKDLGRASCVSKHWRKFLKQDEVWKMVFRSVYKGTSSRDWKSTSRDVYIQKCRWKYGNVVENLIEGFNVDNIHLHGSFLASGGPIESLRNAAGLLAIETGKFECDPCDEGFNFSLCRHHNGWIAVPASHFHSSRLLLWNLRSGEKTVTVLDGQGTIACLDFAGNPPNTVVTGSSRLKIWDIKTGECTMTINTVGKGIQHLVYLQTDKRIVAGIRQTIETEVSVFDAETGDCLVTLPVLMKLAYMNCSGERIVTSSKGSIRGKIQLWDRESGECINVFGTGTIGDSRFSMNQRMIAVATLNFITVWDLDSGQSFRQFDLRHSMLLHLPRDKLPSIGTFSSLDFDGNRIACGFKNGLVLIFTMAEVASKGGNSLLPMKIRPRKRRPRILEHALTRIGRWSILVSAAMLIYSL